MPDYGAAGNQPRTNCLWSVRACVAVRFSLVAALGSTMTGWPREKFGSGTKLIPPLFSPDTFVLPRRTAGGNV